MANLLDRFNKDVLGSIGSIADFSPVISASGDFKRVVNIETILLSWNNILLTPTRTYDHDPEYGCDVFLRVFDPADSETQEGIENDIISSLTRYDDRASVEEVEVTFLKNLKGFKVDVFVEYKGDKTILSTVIDENLYLKFMG